MTNYVITEVPGGRAVDHVYPVCFGPIFESGGVYCGENIKFYYHPPAGYKRIGALLKYDHGQLHVLVQTFLERTITLQGLTQIDVDDQSIEFARPNVTQARIPGHAYGMVVLFHAMRLAGSCGVELGLAIYLYLRSAGFDPSEFTEAAGELSMREVMGIVCMAGKMLREAFLAEDILAVTYAVSSNDNGTIFSSEQFSNMTEFKNNVNRAISEVPDMMDNVYRDWEGHEDLADHEQSEARYYCSMPYNTLASEQASFGNGRKPWCPLTGGVQSVAWGSGKLLKEYADCVFRVGDNSEYNGATAKANFIYTWDQVTPLVQAFMSVFIDESKGESK